MRLEIPHVSHRMCTHTLCYSSSLKEVWDSCTVCHYRWIYLPLCLAWHSSVPIGAAKPDLPIFSDWIIYWQLVWISSDDHCGWLLSISDSPLPVLVGNNIIIKLTIIWKVPVH